MTDFVADWSSWRPPEAYGFAERSSREPPERLVEHDVAVADDRHAVDRHFRVAYLGDHRVELLGVHTLRGRGGRSPSVRRPVGGVWRRGGQDALRHLRRAWLEAVEGREQSRLYQTGELGAAGDQRGHLGVPAVAGRCALDRDAGLALDRAAVALPPERAVDAVARQRCHDEPCESREPTQRRRRCAAAVGLNEQARRVGQGVVPDELRPGGDSGPTGRDIRRPALARLVIAHLARAASRGSAATGRCCNGCDCEKREHERTHDQTSRPSSGRAAARGIGALTDPCCGRAADPVSSPRATARVADGGASAGGTSSSRRGASSTRAGARRGRSWRRSGPRPPVRLPPV